MKKLVFIFLITTACETEEMKEESMSHEFPFMSHEFPLLRK